MARAQLAHELADLPLLAGLRAAGKLLREEHERPFAPQAPVGDDFEFLPLARPAPASAMRRRNRASQSGNVLPISSRREPFRPSRSTLGRFGSDGIAVKNFTRSSARMTGCGDPDKRPSRGSTVGVSLDLASGARPPGRFGEEASATVRGAPGGPENAPHRAPAPAAGQSPSRRTHRNAGYAPVRAGAAAPPAPGLSAASGCPGQRPRAARRARGSSTRLGAAHRRPCSRRPTRAGAPPALARLRAWAGLRGPRRQPPPPPRSESGAAPRCLREDDPKKYLRSGRGGQRGGEGCARTHPGRSCIGSLTNPRAGKPAPRALGSPAPVREPAILPRPHCARNRH